MVQALVSGPLGTVKTYVKTPLEVLQTMSHTEAGCAENDDVLRCIPTMIDIQPRSAIQPLQKRHQLSSIAAILRFCKK